MISDVGQYWFGNLGGLAALVGLPVIAFQHNLVDGGRMWQASLVTLIVVGVALVAAWLLPLVTFGLTRIGMFGALIAGIATAIVGEPQAILPMAILFVGGGVASAVAHGVARGANLDRPQVMA